MAWFRREQRNLPAIPEMRAPKAATQALRWTTPGRATPPDWDAAQAFQYGVYSNVVIYACFEAIANTIASLAFRVGADPEKPTDYDPTHPMARMLNFKSAAGPNPESSAFDLWQYSIVQFLATGRFGWEIEAAQSGGVPVALWPLVSAHLIPVPSKAGSRYFDSFEYGRRDQPRRLMPDQIVYGWKPKGTDFRQPESALEAAHLDISIAVAQSRYDYAFLKNDSRPAALVITEEFEDEDSYRAFKTQWESNYGGPYNAGRTAFLEASGGGEKGVTGAVDVKILGMSAKDTQAAQRYSDRLQQIAMAIGVPWSRLDASGRTFDNASEEDKIWWTQKLVPLIRRFQSYVNIQLAPRFGNAVGWFDLSQVESLKEKPEPVTQKVGVDALVAARIMTRDEARAEYGLPPLPEGEGGMLALPEPAALNPGPAGSGDAGDREVPAGLRPGSPSPPAELRVDLDQRAAEVRRARIWSQTDQTVRNLERTWERAFVKLFTTQRNSVIARLESNRGRRAVAGKDERAPADEIFDRAHWQARTAEEAAPLFEVVVTAGGERVAHAFDLAFDVEAPYAQDFIRARANQLAGQVTDTTYDQIHGQLAEGVAAGEGIPDLSKRVEGVFETATSARATTIARTEVISAYNGSASLTAAQYPSDVVAGQEWISTRDGKTRESHQFADGQTVPIGVPFRVGSSALAYPGDPAGSAAEVVNCRCTLAMLTPEEMKDRGIIRMSPRLVADRVIELAVDSFDERLARLALRSAA